MQDVIGPALVLGVIFWGIVAVIREVAQSKLRQRVLDKGANPANINMQGLFARETCSCSRYSPLKWGMILVGIGLVLLIAQILPREVSDEATIGAMLVVAGVCLLVFHFIVPAADKTEEKKTGR
jgi:hypothetical protein